MSTNFTKVAEDRMEEWKNKFGIPQELALARFDEIKKDYGKSNFYSEFYGLMGNCGYEKEDFKGKTFEEVTELLKKLKTEKEVQSDILDELYLIYSDHKRQGEYMERIVKKQGKEFCNDCVRVAILKQFVKYLQEDMKSIHKGVSSVIRYIKRGDKNCKTIEDVIAKIDESIFDNINDDIKLSKHPEKTLSKEGKDLLKEIDDLSNCVYKGQGSTRKAMYTFAFAFGLKYYEDSEELNYNKYKDVNKFFVDTFNDNLFRYIGENRNRKNNAIPSGETVNFKNFAETICVYYLSKEDANLTRYNRYVSAMNCIEKCKEDSEEIQKETQATQFYRDNYMDVIKHIETDDELVAYILDNYFVPKNKKGQDKFKIKPIETELIETITGETMDKSVRVTIVNKFIENKFVGDGPITGVTTFVNKSKKLGISDITDDSLNEYATSKEIDSDKDRTLIKIADGLTTGEFWDKSKARETLFKFAFIFDMKLYKDEEESCCENRDVEKTLFVPLLSEGVDYESKLDTVFAYYLLKDGTSTKEKTETAIGKKMKKAYDVLGKNKHGLIRNSIADPKTYFWETVVNMSEEEFLRYIEENFEDEKEDASVNDFYVEADQITAFDLYNSRVDEIRKTTIENENEIKFKLYDDVEDLVEVFRCSKYNADEDFMKALVAMMHMVSPYKEIKPKNISRTKLISLEYYNLISDLKDATNFELTYDEVFDYINTDLIKARYNPLDIRSMFDLFIIFLVYMKVTLDTPKI